MVDLQSLLTDLLSGDDQNAEAAAIEIPKHKQAGLEALKPLLSSENPDHRWWSLRALAAYNDTAMTDHFIDGLGDPDLAVRQCAALALREVPDPYAIPELIDAIGHSDQILSQLARDALVTLGKQATQPLLEMIKNSQNQTARLQGVRALAMIGDEASITMLFQMLDGDSRLMEYWASLGLEKMGIGMTFFSPGS